jgi:hypothetical protein
MVLRLCDFVASLLCGILPIRVVVAGANIELQRSSF